MRRGRFLAAVGAAGLAGCVSAPAGDDTPGGQRTITPAPPTLPSPDGVDLPVPRTDMYAALPRDRIPAIVEPAFGPDWGRVEVDGQPVPLPEDDAVIGVERDGAARAYPLRILD